MTELQDIYDNLNNSFSLDGVARYDAKQAEVYRKVVLAIRDAVPGGHEVDLDGLVALVRGLVPNAELWGRRFSGGPTRALCSAAAVTTEKDYGK